MSGPGHIDRLADFNRDRRIFITSALALIIGITSAYVAVGLVWLINLFTNISFFQQLSGQAALPQNNHLGLLVIIVPAIGGLAIGLMARYGSDKIRGHGIPEALEAILIGRSKMNAKVAILKPLSSAISIGTGGPFGAEGPIIMTGGAFGSLFAQLFNLTSAERKTLLVAGAAGGMSAIFATPIAAVLIAVELLLFEWKPRSLIPVAVAASVAGAMRVSFLGQGPIFPIVPHISMTNPELLWAVVVGLVAGLASGLLTTMVYTTEDLFPKCRLHWMWWPAIGGLCVGLGGFIDPRVLGVGYSSIHELLRGQITGDSAVRLLIGKALVWSIALGSGTSGGVLAPLLIIGGAIGAVAAPFIPSGDPALWVLVSMAAMMGGTMRSPLTGIIFMLELTHDLNTLPALLIGTIAAYATTVTLLRRSILTEKLARRGHHIMREYVVDPLESMRVSEVMDTDVATIPANMPLLDLSNSIALHDPVLTRRHALPIVDEHQQLVGLITRSDILRALQEGDCADRVVIEIGRTEVITVFSDDLLRHAVDLMLIHNVGRLPVVERDNPGKLIGMLGRSSLMQAYERVHSLEHELEMSWSVKNK
jgi:CIC family chloride channel protein